MLSLYILSIIFIEYIFSRYFREKNQDILSVIFGLPAIAFIFVELKVDYELLATPETTLRLVVLLLVLYSCKGLYRIVGNLDQEKNYRKLLWLCLAMTINLEWIPVVIALVILPSIYINIKTLEIDKKMYYGLTFILLITKSVDISHIEIMKLILLGIVVIRILQTKPSYTEKLIMLFMIQIFYLFGSKNHYIQLLVTTIPFLVLALDDVSFKAVDEIKKRVNRLRLIQWLVINYKIRKNENVILKTFDSNEEKLVLEDQSQSEHVYRSDTIINGALFLLISGLILAWGIVNV